MAGKKDDVQNSSVPNAGAGKKPGVLLDLKATVVDSAGPSVESRAAFAGGTSAQAAAPAKPGETTASPAHAADKKPTVDAKGSATGRGESPSPAASATAFSAAAPVSTKARGGFGSHLLSGLAGGALTLLGATQLAPLFGFGGDAGNDQRFAALEQKFAKAADEPAQRLASANARIAKLEDAAQALASGQVRIVTDTKLMEDRLGKSSGLGDGAAEKLGRLEEQLAQMVSAAASNPQAAGRLPQLAQLTGKIGEVETVFATRVAQLKAELLQQMDQRFTRSGELVETTRSTLSQRAQSVEQSVKIVTDETSALRAGVDAVKLELDKRFREAAKPADVQTAVASVATKVTALEANMQGVVKSEQDRNATAGNILLSLELANLKRALDRGGKYAAELAAVRGLAGPKLDLTVLDANKDIGVPSLAVLGQELSTVAHGMLDAETEPASASIAERLLSGAKSIVRVRKVDFAAGDQSTEAQIARMEQALKEGRLADVVEESKKLSPKSAVPAAKWLERIRNRAAIDAALASLDASLKTSLAGGAAPKKVAN